MSTSIGYLAYFVVWYVGKDHLATTAYIGQGHFHCLTPSIHRSENEQHLKDAAVELQNLFAHGKPTKVVQCKYL